MGGHSAPMGALLAIAAILGGLLTALLGAPVLGFWALLLAPVGGSVAVLAVGLAAARPAARQRSRDEAIDAMVADLRSVLPRREDDATVARSPAEHASAEPPRRRAVG